MKKRKALKSAVLVGLSAVLVGGIAMAAAGCGGGRNANEITVSMFSSTADKATNQKIADEWAAEYNEKNGTEYTVKISNQTDKAVYFNKLSDNFAKGTIGEVMYLAPSNVKLFALSGRVVDLTQFIVDDDELVENIQDVWPNAVSYYGLDTKKNAFSGDTYTMGQNISYKADGAEGKGFYTDNNEKVGLYGLPKDYSNFSMGYNRVYFTDAMKKAYTTTLVNAERSVWAGKGNTSSNSTGTQTETGDKKNLKYDASTGAASGGSNYVITYAVDGEYTNPYNNNEKITFKAGDPARIINPGIPVNIKPFNFYMWKDYNTARTAGDPIANLVDWATKGRGYTVTIPGFPDETFEMPESVQKDPNAPYDTSMGHITYTYAEYGALLWSLTYYLNTFAWDNNQDPTATTASKPGQGGVLDSEGNFRTVYGGEQYEGGEQDGFQLYVLPWLYSNDANLIDSTNKLCTDNREISGTSILDSAKINVTDKTKWAEYAGTAFDTVKKLRLSGEYEDVEVQYGLNSQRFIETYAAFLAIGSDWNGNPNDTAASQTEGSGWLYFREGRSIFYGAGTWDSAVRNEEDKENVDLGQMPAPVAERYALYSYIKDANYNMTLYSNTDNDMDGKDGEIQSTRPTPTKVYEQKDIIANQVCRQDKWGARMDSVGYAVTSMSLQDGKPTEKTKAAASLCAALTISEKPQISLTYGGAQLPNFRSQCEDLLNYQEEDHADGAFKDMITPEGSATVKNTSENPTAGTALWDAYYAIAKKMGDAAAKNDGRTVAEFLAGENVNGQPVNYDTDFANTHLNDSEFARADTTAKSRYSFAMKVLRMVAFRKSDFDLLIRMQYGLNAVRDSSMYTYNDDWLDSHDARAKTDNNLCYYRARDIKNGNSSFTLDQETYLKRNTQDGYSGKQFLTPFVWCMTQAKEAQELLDDAFDQEKSGLIQAGILA